MRVCQRPHCGHTLPATARNSAQRFCNGECPEGKATGQVCSCLKQDRAEKMRESRANKSLKILERCPNNPACARRPPVQQPVEIWIGKTRLVLTSAAAALALAARHPGVLKQFRLSAFGSRLSAKPATSSSTTNAPGNSCATIAKLKSAKKKR